MRRQRLGCEARPVLEGLEARALLSGWSSTAVSSGRPAQRVSHAAVDERAEQSGQGLTVAGGERVHASTARSGGPADVRGATAGTSAPKRNG